jgi:PKD repeat protein/thiol-disulfide isomerase/thioredoxin
MKKILLFLLLAGFLTPFKVFAQLPDGSTAPDWTHDDIFGNTHHLYDLLDEGKMVVVEFSATWCGPCWNYMQTGALEQFWDDNGPNGTDEAQVFYIEADQNTTLDDLYGLTPESQGNWVAEIPFPIIDLQWGEDTDTDYGINYYPTLYAVCADKTLYEVGQVPASVWDGWIQSCSLSAEVADVQDATCYGDGEIILNVTGGKTPITYNWSNGTHGTSLQNVGAGTYSVTVVEANGKMSVIEDIVIDGAETPITLASSEIEDALCFESATGAVYIELEEGVAPYSYDWSNGSHGQNLTNVAAGTYTLNATDDNGCPFEETFTVDEPEELTADIETTPEYCELENGSITLDIDGGVGNYDISSSEGTVVGNHIYDLTSGFVTATVEDGNGCIWEDDIEIELEAAPDLYFTPSPLITCVQPTTNVTSYVTGGSGDYEFDWTTTNGNIIGPIDQATILVDQEGDYQVEVYDIYSGCLVFSSVAVNTTVDPPVVGAGTDSPINCEDLEPELQGSGDPANIISWTTPDGFIVSGANTYVPTVNEPGTYIIEVTNPANSCTNVDSVIVIDQINPASANYQYQTSGLTMIGTDISTGSNLSGWTWTFGDGNSSTDPNTVHTFAAEGTYDVCLSVQNGCGSSNICYAVQVIQTGSSISVNADILNVLCNADATGAITIIVNGGTGNYTYTWTGPNGQQFTDPSIDSLIAGVYQLVISDDEGNLFIGEYTITEPTALTLVGSTVVDNLCFAQSTGSVAVDITGGTGPFSYSFNGGPFQPENSVTNLPAGVVECLVNDANGCPFVAGPYTIQEPAVISHEAAITAVKCFGDANGAVTLTVSGGVAPYSYLWDFGGNTTPELTQLPAGTYTCAVTDHNGCLSPASVQVTQPDLLAAANIQATDASNVEQNNGTITIEIIGGVAPYQVAWSNGATGTSLEGLVPGAYTYAITDANGCITNSTSPVIINGIVSTSSIDWTQYISIAPNPSKGNVIVSWKGLQVENGIMTLVTPEGKRLQSRRITEGTGNWDLSGSGLSSGIYIVLLEMKGDAVPFKLVVL